MTTPTTPPPTDLRQLATDLGVYLPAVGQLDWDRVRSLFLVRLLERLPGANAGVASALHRRRLAGDEPSQEEWTVGESAVSAALSAAHATAGSAASAAFHAARATSYEAPDSSAFAARETERTRQRADLLDALLAEPAAPPADAPAPPPGELPPQAMQWLKQAAAGGRTEPQAILNLLDRVAALEAAATPQPDKLDRLIALDRAEDEAGARPPDLTLAEAGDRWGLSSRNAVKARAAALGVELRRESSTRTVWSAETVALVANWIQLARTPANFPEAVRDSLISYSIGPARPIEEWGHGHTAVQRNTQPEVMPEPPELSAEEAFRHWLRSKESPADCVRRIHRAGWDAAMAAVKAQRQQSAAEAKQEGSHA